MSFIGVFLLLSILACILYFLGKLWSSLLCGCIFLIVSIYFSYTAYLNTKFECSKLSNKCIIMENRVNNQDFREIYSFRLSDIQEIKYEENIRTRVSRKRGKKNYIDKDIIFIMNDGTKKYYPSVLISKNTEKNYKIINNLNAFLINGDERYTDMTQNKKDIRYGWWVFFFFLGCYLGMKAHENLFEDIHFFNKGEKMSKEEKALLHTLKNFKNNFPKEYPQNVINFFRKAGIKDNQIEIILRLYRDSKSLSEKEYTQIISFLDIKK